MGTSRRGITPIEAEIAGGQESALREMIRQILIEEITGVPENGPDFAVAMPTAKTTTRRVAPPKPRARHLAESAEFFATTRTEHGAVTKIDLRLRGRKDRGRANHHAFPLPLGTPQKEIERAIRNLQTIFDVAFSEGRRVGFAEAREAYIGWGDVTAAGATFTVGADDDL